MERGLNFLSLIVIPAYVIADIPGLICGYHLVLIRTNVSILKGKYLFWMLSDNSINYQYEIEASEVTRFSVSNY